MHTQWITTWTPISSKPTTNSSIGEITLQFESIAIRHKLNNTFPQLQTCRYGNIITHTQSKSQLSAWTITGHWQYHHSS